MKKNFHEFGFRGISARETFTRLRNSDSIVIKRKEFSLVKGHLKLKLIKIFITMITRTLTCIVYFDFYYGVFLIIII